MPIRIVRVPLGMLWPLLASCFSLEDSGYPKHATLFENGANTDGAAVTIFEESSYTELLETFRGACRSLETSSTCLEMLQNRPSLFTGRGSRVRNSTCIRDGDDVFLVNRWNQFVWPVKEIGHKVAVDGVFNADGQAVELESIESTPRAFSVLNFMTPGEADALVESAQSITDPWMKLKRSGIGADQVREGGGGEVNSVRTSENAFDSTSPIAVTLMHRAFKLLGIEFDDLLADGIQVLHYQPGNAYIPHHDYFPMVDYNREWKHNFDATRNGSNRFATVFLYLNDVEDGGETVFPTTESQYCTRNATAAARCAVDADSGEELEEFIDIQAGVPLPNAFDATSWESKLTQQCKSRFSVQARKGNALLFYSQKPMGAMDHHSLHGACPVLQGEKWAANLWVWNGPRYQLASRPTMTGDGYVYEGPVSELTEEAQQVHMHFRNDLEEECILYWEDTEMATLAAGASTGFDSFDGHEWNVQLKAPKDPELEALADQVIHHVKVDRSKGKRQTYVIDEKFTFGGTEYTATEAAPEMSDDVTLPVPISATFVNGLGHAVDLYYQAQDGSGAKIFTLPHSRGGEDVDAASVTFDTYEGHSWFVTPEGVEEPLMQFLVDSLEGAQQTFEITHEKIVRGTLLGADEEYAAGSEGDDEL